MLAVCKVKNENSVISTFVSVAGNCTIRSNTFLGLGALIQEKRKVGTETIIGMGAVVVTDIPDKVVAIGSPVTIVKTNDKGRVFKECVENDS